MWLVATNKENSPNRADGASLFLPSRIKFRTYEQDVGYQYTKSVAKLNFVWFKFTFVWPHHPTLVSSIMRKPSLRRSGPGPADCHSRRLLAARLPRWPRYMR